ncbi:MAG: acyl-CoA dehydrogenase family protein [Acidimicrobiales bacterium]
MTTTDTFALDELALVEDRVDQLLADFDSGALASGNIDSKAFWGRQFDLGLAWVQFPENLGGLGLSPKLQESVNARLRQAGAPTNGMLNPIAGMAAPTLLTHGSADQHERYLRRLFTCEDIWCQLFSEPGAGSDVASLATRAVRDGDEWLVNGQKVWTTMAHLARWGLLVTRTDPEAPKHRGLTYFVLDMRDPGVEVRPLRQMTGEAEFNEVYLTDARIPDSERLGDVGGGWGVALTTLMNERVSIGGSVGERGSGAIGEAVKLFQATGCSDPVLKGRLMDLWVRSEAARLTNLRASQNRSQGNPGPEGSVAKLAFAELNKAIYDLCMNILGPSGMLYGDYTMTQPDRAGIFGQEPTKMFLRCRANSIEGGTSEIMRNILGERVLGLPGDVRTDKELAWSLVPRN